MSKKLVSAVPAGYSSVTPYLIVDGGAKAIDFYKKAFGAVEVMRMGKPGGKVGHAELQIGDSKFMLADEYPERQARGPKAYGGSAVSIHVYLEDVDNVAKKAVAAGAKLVRPVENMFYGDRSCTLVDPFGHQWHVATHIEDISEEEMQKRIAALEASQ